MGSVHGQPRWPGHTQKPDPIKKQQRPSSLANKIAATILVLYIVLLLIIWF